MRVAQFFLLLSSLFVSGCHNAHRDQPMKQGAYSHAVIRKQMAYEEERTNAALAPYFKIVTWADVRLQNIGDRTLIVDSKASRGFWGSSTEFVFIDFSTNKRVGLVSCKRGMFYGGMEPALDDLYQHLDGEAAHWSSHTKTAPVTTPALSP